MSCFVFEGRRFCAAGPCNSDAGSVAFSRGGGGRGGNPLDWKVRFSNRLARAAGVNTMADEALVRVKKRLPRRGLRRSRIFDVLGSRANRPIVVKKAELRLETVEAERCLEFVRELSWANRGGGRAQR